MEPAERQARTSPYSHGVASPALESTRQGGALAGREDVGALLLAASLPFLFLHERYQPELDVGIGSTTVDARLSDLALVVVLVAAGVAWRRARGSAGLAAARASDPER